MGAVNAVVPHAELEAVALQWASEINAKSPTAQRMLKYAFNLVDDGLVGQQLFAGEATRLAYGERGGSRGARRIPAEAARGLLGLSLGVLTGGIQCCARCRPLPMPTGDRLLDVLDDLAAALSGVGPALLPVPTDDSARVGTAFRGPRRGLPAGSRRGRSRRSHRVRRRHVRLRRRAEGGPAAGVGAARLDRRDRPRARTVGATGLDPDCDARGIEQAHPGRTLQAGPPIPGRTLQAGPPSGCWRCPPNTSPVCRCCCGRLPPAACRRCWTRRRPSPPNASWTPPGASAAARGTSRWSPPSCTASCSTPRRRPRSRSSTRCWSAVTRRRRI